MKHLLLALLITPLFAPAQSLVISTIAGTHVPGYSGNGGPALSANIYEPNQLAIDTAGNVYIAETANNVVRKISNTGIITLVAGTHAAGYSGDGGPATAAKLYTPSAVCLDKAGNLYIAELGNARIRKVNTAGIISTYAGTTASGYGGDSGLATDAMLAAPFAVACDSADNIYIADAYNNRIRKVTAATGIITTIAGTGAPGYSGDGGPATAASFSTPIDLAFDKAGNLYVDDIDSSVIRKIDAAGIVTTVAGNGTAGYTGDGGAATSAELQFPYAVCVDTAGNLFITDNANAVIRKVNTAGIISTIAGTGAPGYSGDGGLATSGQISNPGGIKADKHGNLYLADFGNNVVRKIGPVVSGVGSVANNPNVVYTIAPNPAELTIQIACTEKITSVRINDLAGRTLMDHTYDASTVSIDLSSVPTGIYFAIINGREIKRFVKE